MQISYIRRLAQRRGTWNDRYYLMYALLLYAYKADSVLMGSPSMEVKREIGESTTACWEEGFALLEQLGDEKKNSLHPLWDAAYFYGKYCDCRSRLDMKESMYPVILERAGKVIQLYEEAKAGGEPVDSYYNWLLCLRDTYLDMGIVRMDLNENQQAVQHLEEAEKTAWRAIEEKATSGNLLQYLHILKLYMGTCYRARQDEKALQAAEKLEGLLKDWQATGCEDHIVRMLYVQGRIAYERGDLSTAEQKLQQLEPYLDLVKKSTLGSQCFLLALDVSCAKTDLQAAEDAWSVAEPPLQSLWENSHVRKNMLSMAARIRYYLEYGYGQIVKLRAAAGEPIPLAEQKTWFEALDAPLKDSLTRREEQDEAERRSKWSEEEHEKEAWREFCQAKWADISARIKQSDTDRLLLDLELYTKLVEADREYDILAYRLREERQNLTKELYLRTKDPQYVEDYLREIDRLVSGYVLNSARFVDTGISPFECGEDWEHCAINLLRDLYKETGDHGWLVRMLSYLEHAVKRYNLSRIGWYVETFAYLENYMTEETEKERFQALRQARYRWELERMMLTYRISRVKDKD